MWFYFLGVGSEHGLGHQAKLSVNEFDAKLYLICSSQIDDPVHDESEQVYSRQHLKQVVLPTFVGLG